MRVLVHQVVLCPHDCPEDARAGSRSGAGAGILGLPGLRRSVDERHACGQRPHQKSGEGGRGVGHAGEHDYGHEAAQRAKPARHPICARCSDPGVDREDRPGHEAEAEEEPGQAAEHGQAGGPGPGQIRVCDRLAMTLRRVTANTSRKPAPRALSTATAWPAAASSLK